MKSSRWFTRIAFVGPVFAIVLACADPATTSDAAITASGSTALVRAAPGRELASAVEPNGEVEPNGAVSQATSLGDDVAVRGNIHPAGDEDFYRFTALAGDRIYAATQTAWSSATDEYLPDTVLELIDADGTRVLERDDDNGSMTGFASSIAGFPIPAPGTYFLRVRQFSGGEIRPYDLHFRRHEGSPAREVEPNDSIGVATEMPSSGWIAGLVSASSDVDVYELSLVAGSTVFASLDLDEARDTVEWDGVLEFGPFDGSFLRVNDVPNAVDRPSSEALFATVKTTGDYFLRVSSVGVTTGFYQLSVSVHPPSPKSDRCFEVRSTDVPKQIPAGPGRVTSTLSTYFVEMEDVDVHIELTHSHPEDLDVHLRSPAGNDNALFTDVGADAFPNINVTIDDEAAFPIAPASDRYWAFSGQTALSNLVVQPEVGDTGVYRTANRLHWFDGENAGGTWELVIDDDSAGNGGTLTSWGLTVCQAPHPICPNGAEPSVYASFPFEAGPQGFQFSGTNNTWFWGSPGPFSGIPGCNGGSRCWKTNLDGDYRPSSTQDLVSPELDLREAVPPIELSWAMNYQLDSASFDHAWVEVREVDSESAERVWEFLDGTMQEFAGNTLLMESAGWGVRRVDISAFAGRRIELVFHLDSDTVVEAAGLAIDDVTIRHCGCGDSIVGPGEQCDEGAQNGAIGRCCSRDCRFVASGSGCDDRSACTFDETCNNGVCGSGRPHNCNDGNLCTNDSCDAGTGCVHEFNTAPCSGGICRNGMCAVGGGGGSGAMGGVGGTDGDAGASPEGGTGAQGGTAMGGGEAGEATGGTAGEATGGTAGEGGASGGGAAGTPGDLGGEGGEDGGRAPPAKTSDADSDCGCRVPGENRRSSLPVLLSVALGVGVLARRRKGALLALLLLPGCAESAAQHGDEPVEQTSELAIADELGWFERQKLVVENGTGFGSAVALSGTSAFLANGQVGAYAIERLDRGWDSPKDLGVLGVESDSPFAISLAISGDQAIVGTPETDEGGAAYVFARTGSTWTQKARLVSDNTVSQGELFGAAVDIDGDLAIIGAPAHESVYVFAREGDDWFQRKELRPSEAPIGVQSFGAAVGISGDLVVVGAPLDGPDPELLYLAGKVYAYEKPSDLSGSWREHVFVANPRQSYDRFGQSVAIEADTILVGAPGWGSAYAFTNVGSVWSAQQLNHGGFIGAQFGAAVAISGSRAVIGDPDRYVSPRFYPGAAYVYARVETGWILEEELINTTNFSGFGAAVGISGDTILVGAPRSSFGGAVHVERLLRGAGSLCDGDAACGNGHCIEGVCCETACDGACEECSSGTCLASPAGSPGSPTCDRYLCDGATRECPTRCLTHDDCNETSYCRDGSCEQKADIGEACSGSVECLSEHCLARECAGRAANGAACLDGSECERGYCVDGVCCDDICSGQCEACDVAGHEGECLAVIGEPHGTHDGTRAPCAGTDPICKGTCDGKLSNACVYASGSTRCGSSCEDGEETVSACDGLGECVADEPRPCVVSVCDAEGVSCKSSCDTDDDCAGGRSCWENGECEPSPRCTDDHLRSETAPGGSFEDCAPYVCGTDGACMKSCASQSHCESPNVCGPDQRCVPLSSDDAGCGCRTAARAPAGARPIELLLLLLALARRVRRPYASGGRR